MTAETLESRVHLSTVQLPPVAAPSNLTGRFISATQVRLSWTDNSADEMGFVVLRKGINDADFEDVATLPRDTTTYTDTLDPASFPIGSEVKYEVVAFRSDGRSAPAGPISSPISPGPPPLGLRERIWDDIDPVSHEGVGEPVYDSVDSIVDDAYGDGAPAPGVGPDTFAIEWVGEIVAAETKAYDISVVGNDGVRLFLDGKPVIANGWREQDDAEYFAGPMPLTQGQHVKVRLQMYDQTGPATIRLRWNGPGNVREAIPIDFLLPTINPGDGVAELPVRPATSAIAFDLPATATTPATIAVRWQDNAFGEPGYEIQRATNAQFTQGLATFTAGPGADLFVDAGGALARNIPYYYRVRPAGASAWTDAGAAFTGDSFFTGSSFAVPSFNDARMVTLNGYASTTAEGTLKLVPNQNDRTGSAFFNHAAKVGAQFRTTFDVRISRSTGADGMAFVIHNAAVPDPRGGVPNQLRAIGAPGDGLGYAGIPRSVAVTFDFFNDIDQLGLFTNGQPPPGGHADATRVNDPANWPLAPDGTIDLRLPSNGPINLDGGDTFRVSLVYTLDDPNLTYDDPSDDVGELEVRIARPAAPFTDLMTTKFDINLANALGGPLGVMGFTASNGGLNARQEVLNFSFDGFHVDPPPPPDVFVRGSAWSAAFKQYLEAKGLGDHLDGYRLTMSNQPVPGPVGNAEQILPWINADEIVLKYAGFLPASPAGVGDTMRLTSARGVAYTIVGVTPDPVDPAALVLKLDKPLGGGNPAQGAAPTSAENGDRLTFSIASPGVDAAAVNVRMNVLQGDADHTGEFGGHSVLAADFSAVKKKFFRTTADAPTGSDADYSPFADVNGDGQILANDFSEVKKRFFQQMPPPPAAAAPMTTPLAPPRRLRPAGREVLERA